MEVMDQNAKYLRRSARVLTNAGYLPEDWIVQTLGELMRLTNGRAFSPAEWSDSGVPIIRIQNLNDPNSEFNFFSGMADERNIVKEGDLLFAWSGTTGSSFGARVWAGPTGVLNQHIFKVLPDPKKLSPTFAFRMLLKAQYAIERQAHGFKASFVHVKKSDLVSVSVGYPPMLKEQRMIAGALEDVDALIDTLEQSLTKKRQIKQGAMQELLTGKRRLPGFTMPWKHRQLKSLANIQRGASPRPIDDPIWFDDSSAIGWVRISDVTSSGMFLQSTSQKLSNAGVRQSRFVRSGSLIMSICATVGRPVITTLDTCIHDGFVVFDALAVNQNFLYYALLNIEDGWTQHGQTGSQMNLNTGLIKRTYIPVPDEVEEQTAIAQILLDMGTEITALEARLAKTRALKHAMAQALLTGRIRLVEPTA